MLPKMKVEFEIWALERKKSCLAERDDLALKRTAFRIFEVF